MPKRRFGELWLKTRFPRTSDRAASFVVVGTRVQDIFLQTVLALWDSLACSSSASDLEELRGGVFLLPGRVRPGEGEEAPRGQGKGAPRRRSPLQGKGRPKGGKRGRGAPWGREAPQGEEEEAPRGGGRRPGEGVAPGIGKRPGGRRRPGAGSAPGRGRRPGEEEGAPPSKKARPWDSPTYRVRYSA